MNISCTATNKSSRASPACTLFWLGVVAAGSSPRELFEIDGTLYFRARGDYGIELYKSNGTTSGTVLVRNINPATTNDIDSVPNKFIAVGSNVFFAAKTPTTGEELWVTDGTTAGTRLVLDIHAGGASSLRRAPRPPESVNSSGGKRSQRE